MWFGLVVVQLMFGVMVDLVAVILSGLRPHGGFGISQIKQ